MWPKLSVSLLKHMLVKIAFNTEAVFTYRPLENDDVELPIADVH